MLVAITADMDPWDIDILRVSERFNSMVEMAMTEGLHVPARIILAAAILYRMKVETLHATPQEEETELVYIEPPEPEEEHREENKGGPTFNIPPLVVPVIRKPKRRVTLEDLINALDRAMTVTNRRKARRLFKMDLKGEDIREQLEALLALIIEKIESNGGIVTFSELTREKDTATKIRNFSFLLHLHKDNRIDCEQPELFGEIFVSLPEGKTA